jgi:hypothetical protein
VLTQLVSSPDLPGCNVALRHRLSAPAAREDEVRNDRSFFSGMGRQRRRRVLSLGEWSKAIRKLLDDLSSRQTRELYARPGFLRQSTCCAVAVTPRLRSCAGGDAYAARFNVECAAPPIMHDGLPPHSCTIDLAFDRLTLDCDVGGVGVGRPFLAQAATPPCLMVLAASLDGLRA